MGDKMGLKHLGRRKDKKSTAKCAECSISEDILEDILKLKSTYINT